MVHVFNDIANLDTEHLLLLGSRVLDQFSVRAPVQVSDFCIVGCEVRIGELGHCKRVEVEVQD